MDNLIHNLQGQRCFVANHIYGTMFLVKIGNPEIHLSDDESIRTIDSEWGITVEGAQWSITNNGVVTSSNSSEIERKAAISDLINKVVESVSFNKITSQLSVEWSSGITLEIESNFQEEVEGQSLWSLKTPKSIISFYQGGRFEEEKEPENIKKL